MKKTLFSAAAFAALSITCCGNTSDKEGAKPASETALTIIQTDNVVKRNVRGASGANACFLTDSDKSYPRKHSTTEALRAMGVGSLRFPYGHLADNYLWTVPPYEEAEKGLRPKVASTDVPPAKWDWAVDSKGFFSKDLGFDDYVAMCRDLEVEPLIVVNVLSFQYPGGPSREELIRSAAEWVRYANVTKKYGIRYWQLGNEVEKQDGKSRLTKELYTEIYGQMAAAMKQVDATIRTGTGVLGRDDWNRMVLEQHHAAGLVDFISCHQYTWKIPLESYSYEGWREYKGVYVPNIRKMEKLLDSNPAWKETEILVTETNSKGAGVKWAEGEVSDLYKSLLFYEMNMEELAAPHVKYTYFWTTHSPWLGEYPSGRPIDHLFDSDNNPTASGQLVGLVNRYLLPDMLGVHVSKGYLRIRATATEDGSAVHVFVLNKGNKPAPVDLCLRGRNGYNAVEKVVFAGKSPRDQRPKVTTSAVTGSGDDFSDTATSCSLTIYRFEKR